MNNNENHTNSHPQKEKEFFSKVEVKYTRSKEDIWAAMEPQLEESTPMKEGKVVRMAWFKYAAAAMVMVLVGSSLFLKYYSVAFTTSLGEQKIASLPDGSKVYLNQGTTLSYAPYWWFMDREVHLEGEAFFEVEKGAKFSVESQNGMTQVLGTSFNIYAKDTDYEVYCKTGKVSVRSQDIQQIIYPGELVTLTHGNLQVQEAPENQVISWRLHRFIFNTTPLNKVIQDIERQYFVTVELDFNAPLNYHYTGLFERSITVDEALEIICFSLNLHYSKTGKNAYTISQ